MTAAFRNVVLVGILATLGLPATLHAQRRPPRPPTGGPGFLFHTSRVSVGVRGGFNVRSAGSGVYGLFTDTLTLKKRDFNAFSIAGDVGVAVAPPIELVLSAGYTSTNAPSEFRNWVDENDLPITQRTSLSTVPITLAVRWDFASRGRQIGRFVWIHSRFVPYVGAGGGTVWYSLRQTGSFVDFMDLSIFQDELTSDGWAPLGLIMAGADYSLGKRVILNADVRYLWSNAELRRDFVSFTDGLDLSGVQFSAGLHVRI